MYSKMENKQKKLIMTCGLPGSGKSTWVDNFVYGRQDYVILSTDRIIEQIAYYENKTYNEVFKDNIKHAEKKLNIAIDYAIRNNMNIIWDQTNISKKTRAKKLKKIPKDYKIIAVVFNRTPEFIRSGNELRKQFGRNLPDNVLESFIQNFEEPTLDEGFSRIDYVDVWQA